MGFARMGPDEPIREDELAVMPLLQLGLSSGVLDLAWLARLGRGYADGLRLAANVEHEVYRARFKEPVLASGADQRTAMELASQLAGDFLPLVDQALMGIYRRQQELVWIEDMVEDIENELERAGVLRRPERVPAMCFLDLVGYTRLTEEHGDQVAAELAESLAVLVNRSSREHGGVPVKWLGDGVMVHFREPAGAVLSALRMVEQLPEAGLPPHRQPGRPDRRPRHCGPGPGQPERSRVGPAPGRDLRGSGGAPAQGVRPPGTGAGGRPRVTYGRLRFVSPRP